MTKNSETKEETDLKDWLKTAQTLSKALPYLQRYDKKAIVIKYGGHAMGNKKRAEEFARDMVLLNQCGIDPIIVHGGGPQINSLLERLNIKSQFVNGIRVTDSETMQVVQMVLAGTINKDIVSDINAAGGLAIGLCGKDANLIRAKQVTKTYRDPDSNIEKILDLGFAGEPSQVNPAILSLLQGSDIIPVIAPVAMGDDGTAYNVNADTAAGSIAGAIEAERLLLLTDVEGVKDKTGKVLKHITIAQAKEMIADGTAYGGMIPKLETCIDALEKGVKGVVIIDGRMPHSVLVELFTEEGAGTLVTA